MNAESIGIDNIYTFFRKQKKKLVQATRFIFHKYRQNLFQRCSISICGQGNMGFMGIVNQNFNNSKIITICNNYCTDVYLVICKYLSYTG